MLKGNRDLIRLLLLIYIIGRSLHSTPGAHYESAATRMYAGGRTETIRSCSPESIAFARAMTQRAPPPARRDALRAAVAAHRDYTAQVWEREIASTCEREVEYVVSCINIMACSLI